MITFRTELEGLIPTYGDLIAVAHDLPRWGQGGEVIGWDPGTRTLALSERMEWGDGTHWIALRKRDGSVAGPFESSPGATAQEMVLAEDPGFAPYTGTAEERTHFAFGPGEAWSMKARVLAVRPRGEQIEIACVGEHEAVHEAELAA